MILKEWKWFSEFLCLQHYSLQFHFYNKMDLVKRSFFLVFGFILTNAIKSSMSCIKPNERTHDQIFWHLLALALCSSMSQIAIAYTIRTFGAVVFTILMIGRIIPQGTFCLSIHYRIYSKAYSRKIISADKLLCI